MLDKKMKNFFNKLSSELNENTSEKHIVETRNIFGNIAKEILKEENLDENILDKAKEVGSSIASKAKQVFEQLKAKIKSFIDLGFKFGYNIGKTIKGKLVLFNRSGQILTPELKNISTKDIRGKKKLVLTLDNKRSTDLIVSNDLSFGYSKEKVNDHTYALGIIQPSKISLVESLGYSSSKFINEAMTDEDVMNVFSKVDERTFESFDSAGPEALTRETKPIRSVNVDYDDFKVELIELLDNVKSGATLKGAKIQVLGIYAPTGWGKSKIIENVANNSGFNYFPVELKQVPIEIIQGFPYLERVANSGEDLETVLNMADDLSKQDKKKIMQSAIKITKMAASASLPPSGDLGNWVLFFDEFNRAEVEKTSAVMNLMLSGELGGAGTDTIDPKTGKKTTARYKLPEKIAIILAMNTGSQKNITDSMNDINDLDIATLERIDRIVFGQHNVASWIDSFAITPFFGETKSGDEVILRQRIPEVILNFVKEYALAHGSTGKGPDLAAPFEINLKVAYQTGDESKSTSDQGGGEKTTSPRVWTAVADKMIADGIKEFKQIDIEELKKDPNFLNDVKKIKESVKGEKVYNEKRKIVDPPDNDESYYFAAWFSRSDVQEDLFSKHAPQFGQDGEEIVKNVMTSFRKKGSEGIPIEDVIFNYGQVRKRFISNFKALGFGSYPSFLKKVYNTISGFKNEEDLKSYMKEKGWPSGDTKISKLFIETMEEDGPAEVIFQTIELLTNDLKIKAGEFKTFAQKIKEGASENELVKKIKLKLAHFDLYKETSRNITKSELEQGEDEE